ncbi:MAG: hypothetical protein Ct9H300mP15_28780 [Gemmatimonadota bacterium]|nr:MAG: hypothetical protein Ct9H300mP15_28780 [Gemmatimonadota bacterium]
MPIAFGATGFTGDIFGDFTPFNSPFLMDPGGLTGFQYDKRYLVPFVERVPNFARFLAYRTSLLWWVRVGSGWPLLEVNGSTYGVLICYESTYPEGARPSGSRELKCFSTSLTTLGMAENRYILERLPSGSILHTW